MPSMKEIRLIRSRKNNVSYGFAFIEYHDVQSAQYTLSSLYAAQTGLIIDEVPISVTFAQPTSFVSVQVPDKYVAAIYQDPTTKAMLFSKYWDQEAYASVFPDPGIQPIIEEHVRQYEALLASGHFLQRSPERKRDGHVEPKEKKDKIAKTGTNSKKYAQNIGKWNEMQGVLREEIGGGSGEEDGPVGGGAASGGGVTSKEIGEEIDLSDDALILVRITFSLVWQSLFSSLNFVGILANSIGSHHNL